MALTWPPLQAQEQSITVQVSKSQVPITVEPLGGPGGAEATRVLEQDLRIQGFRIVPAGQGKYTVRGNATANSLQATVTGQGGNTVINKTFAGDPRKAAHSLGDEIVQAEFGVPGIGNSKIAYVMERGGKKEIFLADYDGANARQVTNDQRLNVGPSLSRDGKYLVYTSYRAGFPDLVLQRLVEKDRKTVAAYSGTNTGGAISPDNTQIAFSASIFGTPEIALIPLTGAGKARPTRVTNTRGTSSSPTWSPDGQRICYVSDERGSVQLYIIPKGGGQSERLSTGSTYSTKPSWSPDGKAIAFTTRQGGRFQIAIYDIATKQTRTVTQGDEHTDPSWSPNGRQLIFTRHRGGGSNLIVLDVGSGETLQVAGGSGNATEATWSR
ncbi:DPP IV N-terminal domain-containing protein [Kamptonema cortianum]|nr:DPP IV N-terminal domain-containing protein [Kamptonema cortianum]